MNDEQYKAVMAELKVIRAMLEEFARPQAVVKAPDGRVPPPLPDIPEWAFIGYRPPTESWYRKIVRWLGLSED